MQAGPGGPSHGRLRGAQEHLTRAQIYYSRSIRFAPPRAHHARRGHVGPFGRTAPRWARAHHAVCLGINAPANMQTATHTSAPEPADVPAAPRPRAMQIASGECLQLGVAHTRIHAFPPALSFRSHPMGARDFLSLSLSSLLLFSQPARLSSPPQHAGRAPTLVHAQGIIPDVPA